MTFLCLSFVRKGYTERFTFRILTVQIDTTTSGGKLIFYIFGALAEFEWERMGKVS